ncbi:MAG: LCP family protein required for cell wall assembly [Verrucomicrobiales bacterium]|jgi:LCP family protein required for cell wall assembly
MTAPGKRPFPRLGFRGRLRRTWPQRFLLLLGPVVAVAFFLAADVFWEARAVLAELPRIKVGPDILAQSGEPGDPVNVLLVGVDSSEGLDPDDPVREGRHVEDEARGVVRPDTILVLRLDPATGNASVLSLPRDLIVEVPGGATTRINATQAVGGMDALISTIDNNFAIPINHFVVADFAGFADIVEIVGGVPIYFPYTTRDLGSGLVIDEPGCWSLNGSESLGYVRARKIEELIDGEWVPLAATSPDLARIERQQQFLVLALEQVLDVGRSDLSRIGEFIDAGTQAVQLDESLTPGDMLELASAFSDYDTEALRVSTLPVAAEFAEDGRYLGEAMIEEESQELLAIFQGQSDGVRPDQVTVEVRSTRNAQVEQLLERGFDAVASEPSTSGAPTIVHFDPADRDEALLLIRYLEGIPIVSLEPGSPLRLDVGPDFSGIRPFPRPMRDISPGLDSRIRAAAASGAPASSVATATGDPPPTSADSDGNTGGPDSTSTSVQQSADVPKDPTTSVDPSRTLDIRGRPPENMACGPTGN